MAKRAEEVGVGGPLSDYDQTYLECRDLRHSWRVMGYFRKAGEVRRTLACERCPTERIDRWSARGDRIGTSYRWPEGYRIANDIPISFHDVRVETLHRVTVFEDEQQMVAGLFTRRSRTKGRTR